MKIPEKLTLLALALVFLLLFPSSAFAEQKSREELQAELDSRTSLLDSLMSQQNIQNRPDSLSSTLTPDDAGKPAGPDLTETGVDWIPLSLCVAVAGTLFIGCYRLLGIMITEKKKTEFIR